MAVLSGGAKPFMQFWKRASGEYSSCLKFGPVVQEEEQRSPDED